MPHEDASTVLINGQARQADLGSVCDELDMAWSTAWPLGHLSSRRRCGHSTEASGAETEQRRSRNGAETEERRKTGSNRTMYWWLQCTILHDVTCSRDAGHTCMRAYIHTYIHTYTKTLSESVYAMAPISALDHPNDHWAGEVHLRLSMRQLVGLNRFRLAALAHC